jgi:prepilin-type N-terminal cleavage/methylation domain-containing protein
VGRKAFTLIELVMVMALILLTVAIAAPRLPDLGGLAFDRGVRRTALLVQQVRQRSLAKQRWYRLGYSFDDARFTASYYGPERAYVDDEEIPSVDLPAPLRVQDIETAGAGKVLGGEAFLHFSPRGMVEPSAIHLGDGKGNTATLLPEFLAGGVETVPGYREMPR